MHVAAQIYHPAVRLTSPEGITYTAVQDPTTERRACGAANDRFLRPIKDLCKQCQVVFARCERKLEGLEQALYDRSPLPLHQVFASGLRMAIEGPEPLAKATCDYIAGDLVKRGLRSATCVYPSKPAK